MHLENEDPKSTSSVILHKVLPVVAAFLFGLFIAFVVFPGGSIVTNNVITPKSNISNKSAVSTEIAPDVPIAETVTVPKPPAPKENKLKVLASTLGYVNVRSGSSTKNPVIIKAKPGATFSYTEISGAWYHILLPDGSSGWINGEYVEDVTSLE